MLREAVVCLSLLCSPRVEPSSTGIQAQAPLSSRGSSAAQLVETHAAAAGWIENRGQWPTAARFVGRLGPLVVRLEPESIALQLRGGPTHGELVYLRFRDSLTVRNVEGIEQRPGHYNYFLGDDPTRWHRRVPAWNEVAYRDAWPGVDVVARLGSVGAKYDVLVDPHVELDQVRFSVEGGSGLRIEASGDLVIETSVGEIRQALPVSYELDGAGARRSIEVRYRLFGAREFGFAAVDRDDSATLVIDPGLIWSTYLGSSSVNSVGDQVLSAAVGPNGEAVVGGWADWGDFPVTPGAFSTPFIPEVAFVTVFDSSGSSLVYSGIIGGTQAGYSRAYALGVLPGGEVVAAGWTSSKGFPTTPGAFDQTKNSFQSSGFVLKMSPDGSTLEYSTLLEGSQSEQIFALAVAPDGSAIVGGLSASANFPTTPGAFDTIHGPGTAPFVAKLDPSGSQLAWSTLLAGWGTVHGLCLDEQGAVLATGIVGDDFLATPGSYAPAHTGGSWDGFVAKLSSDGSQLLWGTYLGGSFEERPNAIAYHPAAGVVVAGRTYSWDYPVTPGAFQTTHYPNSSYDGFVTRLNHSGSALVYSTYLGGSTWDEPYGVAIDAGGLVTVAGVTGTATFPTTDGAFDTTAFSAEGFVTRISPEGSRLFYSTFVGNSGYEQFQALACDALGIATLGGWTTGDYPVTPGCFAPTPFGGQADGMVTRMELVPRGAATYGTSTPACDGPIAIGVTQIPVAGATSFGLYASGAPPSAVGVLGLSPAAFGSPIPLGGALVWVDPGVSPIVLPVVVPATPFVERGLSIPLGATGLQVFGQFVFLNPSNCGAVGGLSASNAIALTVQ
jgi:hypothetical protein